MDGFTGFKTAAAETVPDAVAVMDPFHVAALAGDALDRCRQRVRLPSNIRKMPMAERPLVAHLDAARCMFLHARGAANAEY